MKARYKWELREESDLEQRKEKKSFQREFMEQ